MDLRITILINVVLVAGLVSPPAPAGEAPGWYVFELKGTASLTGKLMSEETASYLIQFQGSVLEVAKTRVRSLKKPSLPGRTDPTGGESSAGSEALAARVLDAIEALGSECNGTSDQAYRLLGKDLEAARPLLHAALSHQQPLVRVLVTKLLGEMGTPDQDLEPVAGRLSDPKPEVRLASIMAMQRLGRQGLPELLAHLKRERVPNNRKMVVKTLQVWNDRRAVNPLLDLQSIEKDPGVQSFIEVALESLISRRGRSPGAWEAHLEETRQRKIESSTPRTPPNEPETDAEASSFAR